MNASSGPLLFARYALPPTELGYCGPEDWHAFSSLAKVSDQPTVDDDLRRLGRAFEGALPYLDLIANVTGIGDPFDRRVVHAYWVGNHLLDEVPLLDFGNSLRDRFHSRIGSGWVDFTDVLTPASVPHHSFHVLAVYPWVGLLRSGQSEISLRVLDRCRIRSGTVVERFGDFALVRFRPLVLVGEIIELGEESTEVVRVAHPSVVGEVAPGDVVSLHWDRVCDVVSRSEANAIEGYLARHLEDVNRAAGDGVRRSAFGRPATVGP